MTSYGAYNAGLPCKNTSCNSHGKPHPNCRCYGANMAKGGEVKNYCEMNKPHEKECEYFAEGGDTFNPDQYLGAEVAAPQDFDPDQYLKKPAQNGFDPDEYLGEGQEEGPKEAPSALDEFKTPEQTRMAHEEAFGRGLAGPVFVGGEKLLGKLGVKDFSDENIKNRKEANPEAALTETAGSLAGLGKVTFGANILGHAIQGMFLQGADEIDKAMLGEGDPNKPVGAKLVDAGENILLAGAASGVGGTAVQGLIKGGGAGISKLAKIAEDKLGVNISSFLAGIGESASGEFGRINKDIIHGPSYKKGAKLYKSLMKKVEMAGPIAVGLDALSGVIHGDDAMDTIHNIARDIGIATGAKVASKQAGKAILWAISRGETSPKALAGIVDYANEVSKGENKINQSVKNLFTVGSQKAVENNDEKIHGKIDDWVKNGGIQQTLDQIKDDQKKPLEMSEMPGMAKGGEVKKQPLPEHDPVASHYPEQNILLNAAKSRIGGYLSSLRPQEHLPKLAFDDAPDQTEQKKIYKKAIGTVINPLSIIDKIKHGTIEAEDMKHFSAMYPELRNTLQQKITKEILTAQQRGEKPSYKIRQGMSLFLGSPLSGEMAPQNIMAAQAVFQTQQAQSQGAVGTPQKKTSAISKSSQSYLTADQASASRQQRQS